VPSRGARRSLRCARRAAHRSHRCSGRRAASRAPARAPCAPAATPRAAAEPDGRVDQRLKPKPAPERHSEHKPGVDDDPLVIKDDPRSIRHVVHHAGDLLVQAAVAGIDSFLPAQEVISPRRSDRPARRNGGSRLRASTERGRARRRGPPSRRSCELCRFDRVQRSGGLAGPRLSLPARLENLVDAVWECRPHHGRAVTDRRSSLGRTAWRPASVRDPLATRTMLASVCTHLPCTRRY
jgi:hypothetical protein